MSKTIVPIFASYCIDYRYDALSSEFLKQIGFENSYFLATNAGAALPLGYDKSCKCIRRPDDCQEDDNEKKDCCPGTSQMAVLRNAFATNLNIALTLQPITTVYLLNHQDCGAIRAFLPCSGYPASDEENKKREICINAKILTYAQKFVKKKFEDMKIILSLIDSNGSVATYDTKSKKWTVIYIGPGKNKDALWRGFKKDKPFTIKC